MVTWSSAVMDEYLAPGASSFTQADIPDLSDNDSESGYWLASYFLNSVLRAKYNERERQYVFNYLRRAETAFASHHEARTATLGLLTDWRQSPAHYMHALSHWEIFLANAWLALKLLVGLSGTDRVFERGGGSVEERLNLLHNRSKHVESAIDSGQLPEKGTVPVWMTNEGLTSVDAMVTWEETGQILRELAKWANALQDPPSAREKIQQLIGQTPE